MKKVIWLTSVLTVVALICLLPALRIHAEESESDKFIRHFVLIVPRGGAKAALLREPLVKQFLGRPYLVGKGHLEVVEHLSQVIVGHPTVGDTCTIWVPIDNDTTFVTASVDSDNAVDEIFQRWRLFVDRG